MGALTPHRGVDARLHAHTRPLRDRAIVYLLLGTGRRRAELAGLDLEQLEPADPDRRSGSGCSPAAIGVPRPGSRHCAR
ncbi:hypothetical protein [Nonomuraea sp. NPDC049400]|uniref:hypothetical protein n=1 Tax=Nonomuraea sp. NPDC049400 TaxID=3364352 RepID=UPI0037B57687